MKKRIFVCLVSILLSGCVVEKQAYPIGGSKADGTIRMGYSFGAFETPKIDMKQMQTLAAQRCKKWGYDDAEAFGGQVSNCVDPSPAECRKMEVYLEFQCLNSGESSPR